MLKKLVQPVRSTFHPNDIAAGALIGGIAGGALVWIDNEIAVDMGHWSEDEVGPTAILTMATAAAAVTATCSQSGTRGAVAAMVAIPAVFTSLNHADGIEFKPKNIPYQVVGGFCFWAVLRSVIRSYRFRSRR